MKYTEIFKLKEMLEKANIPFEFIEHNDFRNGYQICYPEKGEKCVCSVIEHLFSYGSQNDLLEISGLMTKEEIEETHDTVLGYLSAENVFERIKKHYQKQNSTDNNSAKVCQYDDKGGMKMPEKDEDIDKMADDFVNAQEFTGVYSLARKAECGAFWKKGYLAGLKAGKPKWHDLRENPNDLPKPNVPVLICLQFEKWTSSYIAFYRPASDKWQMYNICEAQRDPIYIERDEVIAWCEIPKFEETE